MHPILRNILAVIAGVVIGNILNMGLITIGDMLVLPPEGVDPTDLESIKANIHRFAPKHFIIPFLAHALGCLVGGFTAAKIGATRKLTLALVVGGIFLMGGITMVFMIPNTPVWFILLDLLGAYLPMAWLGGKLGKSKVK